MVLARSNRDIDQKQAIGNYEFTLTPRALVAPNGAMLPCTDKAKLIHLLELGAAEPPDDAQQQLQDASGLQGDAVGLETMDFTHTVPQEPNPYFLVRWTTSAVKGWCNFSDPLAIPKYI